MENKTKISIIIPVFNVGKYISHCIESCIKQSLKEIEIIIVDDGSTDNSIDIAKSYQKSDKRIKIVRHKTNKGLLQARKTGVLKASGKYIQHLDSDDWLDYETCEIIYKKLISSKKDVCHFGTTLWEGQEKVFSVNPYWNTYDVILKRREFLSKLLNDQIAHGAVTVIAKRELVIKVYEKIKDIPKLISLEDMIYTIALSLSSNGCICIPDRLYQYRLNVGNGTRGGKNAENFVSVFKDAYFAFIKVEKMIKESKELSLLNSLKIKKNLHFKQHRFYDWSFLNEKNKRLAIELLQKNKLLGEWLKVLFELNKYGELKYFSEFNFKQEIIQENKEKRIAFYINRLNNGGREKVVQLLANGLSEKGWKVFVFTTEEKNDSDYLLNKKVDRVVLPKDDSLLLEFFTQKLKENSVELVASHNWVMFREMFVFIFLYLNNIKVCHSDHTSLREQIYTYHNNNGFQNILECGQFLNGLTCLSRLETTFWRKMDKNVAFMPNPIEVFKNNTLLKEPNKDLILWVGRLEKVQKQTEEAIKAFAVLIKKRPYAKLIIVGSEEGEKLGDYYNHLKNLCRELDCEKGVEFVGFSKDVSHYFSQASVHWLTSAYEGFPMVWVEAKSSGVPTILYDIPSVELNGLGSIVVKQGDYKSLADVTAELLNNKEKLQALSKEAKEDLLKRFHPEIVMNRWDKFYYEMLTKNVSELYTERIEIDEKAKKKYFKEYILKITEACDFNKEIIEKKDSEISNLNLLLEEKNNYIKLVDTSKFWKLRNLWVKIKSKLN